MKLTTFEKLRRSFEKIGVKLSLPEDSGLIEFEYDDCSYLLDIFEEQEIFCLSEYVEGPNGNLPQDVFETALEVTKSFLKNVEGEWGELCSWISVTGISMKGKRQITQTELKCLLKELSEAHAFMQVNILLQMSGSLPTDLRKLPNQ